MIQSIKVFTVNKIKYNMSTEIFISKSESCMSFIFSSVKLTLQINQNIHTKFYDRFITVEPT